VGISDDWVVALPISQSLLGWFVSKTHGETNRGKTHRARLYLCNMNFGFSITKESLKRESAHPLKMMS
jgi:hypothetical protein